MGVFDPDNFAERPYEGGLNQMGHVTLGAALVAPLAVFLPVWWAVLGAGGVAVSWEAYQLHRKGALRSDYAVDLFYWLLGVWIWAGAIHSGAVTSWAVFFPVMLIGCFCAEYTRIKCG